MTKKELLIALLLFFIGFAPIVFSHYNPITAELQQSDKNAGTAVIDRNIGQSPAELAATTNLAELRSAILKMRKAALSTQRVSDGLIVAEEQFRREKESAMAKENPGFPLTLRKIGETLEITKLAFKAADEAAALENRLNEVRAEIEPETVEEMLENAKKELKNERYEKSVEFSLQGQQEIVRLQSFNTKAQAKAEALASNLVNFLDQYKKEIVTSIVVFLVLLLLLKNRIQHFLVRSRVHALELERETIKKEIMRAQEEFFGGKMPENLYRIRTNFFNEKLREITRKLAVLMEAEKKTSVFGIFPVRAKLKKEETQMDMESMESKKNEGSGLAPNASSEEYFKTGINGLDGMLKHGIPVGSSILIEGGPGSGKTLCCLQIALNACKEGKKVLYMSFEEREDRLEKHMHMFSNQQKTYEKKGLLLVRRFNALDIARSVEALLSEAKKELLINVQPILIPKEFSPDIVIIDSLTSISSAFSGEEYRFRIYMEQLFRYLEAHNITSFLIRETSVPSHAGGEHSTQIEEAVSFLSDGIIALYVALFEDGSRKRALEIVKLRGEEFELKLVEMKIGNEKGILVFPDRLIVGKYKLT